MNETNLPKKPGFFARLFSGNYINELNSARNEISEKSKSIYSWESELKRKEQTLELKEENLNEKEKALNEKAFIVKRYEEIANNYDEDIKNKQEDISNLTVEINNKKKIIEDIDNEIEEKKKILASLNEKVEKENSKVNIIKQEDQKEKNNTEEKIDLINNEEVETKSKTESESEIFDKRFVDILNNFNDRIINPINKLKLQVDNSKDNNLKKSFYERRVVPATVRFLGILQAYSETHKGEKDKSTVITLKDKDNNDIDYDLKVYINDLTRKYDITNNEFYKREFVYGFLDGIEISKDNPIRNKIKTEGLSDELEESIEKIVNNESKDAKNNLMDYVCNQIQLFPDDDQLIELNDKKQDNFKQTKGILSKISHSMTKISGLAEAVPEL